MSHTEVKQFDAMLAVVKYHVFPKEQRRRFQFRVRDVLASLGGVFPSARFAAVIARLVFLHFLDDSNVADRHCSVIHPDLIAISVIAVMMRIESKTDRLVGDRANL